MEKFSKYFAWIFLGLGLLVSLSIVVSDEIAEYAGWHEEVALASMQTYLDQEMHQGKSLNKPVEGTIRCENNNDDVRGVHCYYQTQDGISIRKACYGWRLLPRKYIPGVTWSCVSIY